MGTVFGGMQPMKASIELSLRMVKLQVALLMSAIGNHEWEETHLERWSCLPNSQIGACHEVIND